MTNKYDKWQRKIAILQATKSQHRRQRALFQMNMTGNEWVQAQVDLGILSPKVLSTLNS